MMKVNWKVRFKNKTWLLGFLMAIVAFVYQVLGMFGVLPALSEDQVAQLIGIVMNILVTLGVIVDPTTKGACDSERALSYTEPK